MHPRLPRVNRSRNCTCCLRRLYRIQVLAPTATDPDYCVAVCPECDMTVGREDRWRGGWK